jgi:hypothetical protein
VKRKLEGLKHFRKIPVLQGRKRATPECVEAMTRLNYVQFRKVVESYLELAMGILITDILIFPSSGAGNVTILLIRCNRLPAILNLSA